MANVENSSGGRVLRAGVIRPVKQYLMVSFEAMPAALRPIFTDSAIEGAGLIGAAVFGFRRAEAVEKEPHRTCVVSFQS